MTYFRKPRLLVSIIKIVSCFLSCSAAFAAIDLNGNGFSDVWEKKYNLPADLDPSMDSDQDGASNLTEALFGTDPLDITSFLPALSWQQSIEQSILSWEGVGGHFYQMQWNSGLDLEGWENVGHPIRTEGGPNLTHLELVEPRGFFRIITPSAAIPSPADASPILSVDTDGDGLNDWEEWQIGTDIFDPQSLVRSPVLTQGDLISLTWKTELGKFYQIRTRTLDSGEEWEPIGPLVIGTGQDIEHSLPLPATSGFEFSLELSDQDSDGDGLNDWEEGVLGLDPEQARSDHLGLGDFEEAKVLLAAPHRIEITNNIAINNLTKSTPGTIEIRRLSGVGPLRVHLQALDERGQSSDYGIDTSIDFFFHEELVTLPIELSKYANQSGFPSSMTIVVEESPDYSIEGAAEQTINLIRESRVEVSSFGATGDGVTDDRQAIQDAIDSLVADPSKNTLYFPAGDYRLDSVIEDSGTSTSYARILALRGEGMAERDFIVDFEEGARLYSTVSPVRAHILECQLFCRSLSFYQLHIEKDPVPLEKSKNIEPNGADGVSLVLADLREIETVQFINCDIINCHGPIGTYGWGYDTRGKFEYLKIQDCRLSCPWGANSGDDPRYYGGGQMVNILPWVGIAEYTGNHFDGGSRVEEFATYNTLDRKKDGSHFGSPLRLIFQDNVVDHMRVEAVFQTHDILLGYTSGSFDFPAIGEEASFAVNDYSSPYLPDQIIAIRGAPVGESLNTSFSFTISRFDPIDRILTVRNDGLNDFPLEGISFDSQKAIYLQESVEHTSVITGNVVRALNTGDRSSFAGIVVSAKSIVSDNYVEGFATGILIYGNGRTPLIAGSTGTVIEDNVIYTRRGITETSTTYGIQSWGPNELIRNNLIITPVSERVRGIASRGADSIVEGNTVIAETIVRHDYSSLGRSVGVSIGTTASGVLCRNNTTKGFDVGMGPVNASQSPHYYLEGHRSLDDTLPIDPRGVITDDESIESNVVREEE